MRMDTAVRRVEEHPDPMLAPEIRRKCWLDGVRLGLGSDAFYLHRPGDDGFGLKDPPICPDDITADDWELFNPYDGGSPAGTEGEGR